MKVYEVKNILLYIGILSHLLFSFYFYSLGVALFGLLSVISFSLLFLLHRQKFYFSICKIGIDKNIDFSIIPIVLMIYSVVSVFISFIYVFNYKNCIFKISPFLGFLLDIIMFLTLISCGSIKSIREKCSQIFLYFTIISLSAFIIQAFFWYFFGMELDFMISITGEEQRLIGHEFEVSGINVKRLSGLFAEPAIYAWVMVCFSHFIIFRNYFFIVIYILTIVSIIFSFSLSGYIILVLSMITKCFSEKWRVDRSKILWLLIFMLLVLSNIYPYIDLYLNTRLSTIDSDGSYNDKLSVFDSIMYYFNTYSFSSIFGIGISSSVEISALGFWQSSLLNFGIVGTTILLGWILRVLYLININTLDKFFIFFVSVILGQGFTASISWFVMGSMILLASEKYVKIN